MQKTSKTAGDKKPSSLAEKWLTEEGLFLIECWARDYTQLEVAIQKMGVSEPTLIKWKKKYPQIAEALSKGKEVVDYRVESALLKRALGFKTREVKTVISGTGDKDGNRPVRMETTEKEVIPDVTAILAWLNNRKPDSWKRNRDNVLETTDENSNITVNIIRANSKHKPGAEDTDDEEWDVSEEVVKTGKKSAPAKEVLEKKEEETSEDDWNEDWPNPDEGWD